MAVGRAAERQAEGRLFFDLLSLLTPPYELDAAVYMMRKVRRRRQLENVLNGSVRSCCEREISPFGGSFRKFPSSAVDCPTCTSRLKRPKLVDLFESSSQCRTNLASDESAGRRGEEKETAKEERE